MGLANWKPSGAGDLRGPAARCPAGPDVAPEWARVRRAAAGHGRPHGRAPRCASEERDVSSTRPRQLLVPYPVTVLVEEHTALVVERLPQSVE